MLTEEWRGKVQVETMAHIALSHSAGFGDGKHLGMGLRKWNPDMPEKKRRRGREKRRTARSTQVSEEQDKMYVSNDDLVEEERDAGLDELLSDTKLRDMLASCRRHILLYHLHS